MGGKLGVGLLKKLPKRMYQKQDFLFGIIEGSKVRFWEDMWGVWSYCVVFSFLYALGNSKEVMVEEVWEA